MEKQSLQEEFHYYIAHQDELVEKYNGKYVVIKDGEVLGVFTSIHDVLVAMEGKHERGTYLVQKCGPGVSNYTIRFHPWFVPA